MGEWYEEDTTDLGGVKAEHDRDQALRKRWRPKEGDQYIRVMPPFVAAPGQKAMYFRQFAIHGDFKQLSKNPNNPFSVTCIAKTANLECYACKMNDAIARTAILPDGKENKEVKDFAWRTGAQDRFVMNILVVRADNTALSGEIQTWEVSRKTHTQILGLFATWGAIASPKEGFVLKVVGTKQGRGVQPDVSITPVRGPIPLQGWHTVMPDLDKYVNDNVSSVAEMKAYFAADSAAPAPVAAAPAPSPTGAAAPVGTTMDPRVAAALGLAAAPAPAPTATPPPAASPATPAPAAAPATAQPDPSAAAAPEITDPVLRELLKKAKDPEALTKMLVSQLSGT